MNYLISRILSFIFLLLVLSFLGIQFQSLRGGSAALAISGQRAKEKDIQEINKQLESKENILVRVLLTVSQYVRFDFGETVRGEPVIKLVIDAFKKTAVIAVWAAVFSFFYGILGGITGHLKSSIRNYILSLNYFILANPIFIISLVLLWIFSLAFAWLPPGGTMLSGWYILPAAALGLKAGCRLALFTDEFMSREKKNQYVLTAKAYGFTSLRIHLIFILKNMFLPLISFWLLDFASYLAGAAIVETIFSINGLGRLLLQALLQYDLNLIMGILTFVSMLVFLTGSVQEAMDKYFAKFSSAKTE
ncbi:MAG: ABC transporter permease [Spirochaetia bacterium]|nr:ABC transporter permease [Spirochaetia bacterium]